MPGHTSWSKIKERMSRETLRWAERAAKATMAADALAKRAELHGLSEAEVRARMELARPTHPPRVAWRLDGVSTSVGFEVRSLKRRDPDQRARGPSSPVLTPTSDSSGLGPTPVKTNTRLTRLRSPADGAHQ